MRVWSTPHTILLRFFSKTAAIMAIGVSLLVLAGWLFDVPSWRSILPNTAPTKVNTAFGFFCAGISLWLLLDANSSSKRKRISQIFALLLIATGALPLGEYMLRGDLGVDRFFASLLPAATRTFHDRISFVTALSLALIGFSLFWFGSKRSQYLSLSVTALSLVAVIGYIYDYQMLYLLPGYGSMAFPTAVTFLCLSLGIPAAQPGFGLMQLFTSSVPAGRTVRVLLPVTILMILLLGFAVEEGEQRGLIDTGYGSVVLVLLLILFVSPLIYVYAERINRSEMQNIYLSRLYATLSQVNQIIVRVKRQQELFEGICSIAVKFGKFRLAWIGLYDPGTGQLTPVAESGDGQNKLPFRDINLNVSPFKNGLVGLSVRTGLVQTSNDIQADERMAHWHETAARDGYHSAAAVPIRQNGQIIGFLNLYAADIDFFTVREEQSLLEEMGLDISFALDMMERETERQRAEEELRIATARFQRMIDANVVGIVITDASGRITLANDYYLNLLHVTRQDLLEGKVDWRKFTPPDWLHADEKALQELQEYGVCEPYEKEYLLPNGTRVAIYLATAMLPEPEKQIIAFVVDITERRKAQEELQCRSLQLAALLDASQSLTESLKLAEVMQNVTDKAADVLGMEDTAIYLAEGEHLYLGASTPPLPREAPESFRRAVLADHPHIAEALTTKRLVVLPDTSSQMLTPAEQSLRDALDLRTIIYVPLASGKDALGILILGTTKEPRSFPRNDEDIVRAFANQAGLAIANAKLYEGLSLYTKELENQIAERQRAQERFHLVVESAPNAILLVSMDNKLRMVNTQVEHYFGYDRTELIGMNIEQLIPGRFRNSHKGHLMDFFANPSPRSMGVGRDLYALRKDGSEFPAEIGIVPLESSEEPLLMVTIVDITVRKQAEEKTRRHLGYLTGLREVDQAIASSFDIRLSLNIITSRAVPLLNVDAAGILLLDPVMNSLEYAAIHGFRKNILHTGNIRLGESYAGKAVIDRRTIKIRNMENELHSELYNKLLKEEQIVSYYGIPLIVKGKVVGVMEVFHRTLVERDQEWFDFLDSLAGQAAIAIDNTRLWEQVQRHARDLELRVAERTAALNRINSELEHANRAKDEFLANMSHELRTPLNSILGLSETLLEQRRDPLTEYQQKSLEIISSSGYHLLDLINDVLDLSKIEAGKFDYYPQILNIDSLCRASLSFVKSQALKKSISVIYDNNASASNIYADSRRLKQSLVNLLTNAVKFTPEGGQVTLQVDADSEQDLVEFSVIDNGIGIDPQDLQRLFKPFVQVDSKLSRQFEGTGLGLALVQKLIDMHGGSVHVESEVGSGSRFTIRLPWGQKLMAQQAAAESAPKPPEEQVQKADIPASQPSKRGLVLLAEDNMASILTIGEYLKTQGYQFVQAHDGLEALEKAQSNNPDVILMDIQMPVMDGLEVIRRLRRDLRFVATPMIAITALAMPGDRERCLEAGANEYMSKPVRLKVLKKTIEDLLENRSVH